MWFLHRQLLPHLFCTKMDFRLQQDIKGYVYFLASPDNATQKYLYRTKLNGAGKLELLSPASMKGNHDYSFSTNGKYASHRFSNHFTKPSREMIFVESQKPLTEKEGIQAKIDTLPKNPKQSFLK